MTCATFGKSCVLASCCTSDATTRMSYGDRFMDRAVSTRPGLHVLLRTGADQGRQDRSAAEADGSTLKLPGAIRPSIRRWSLPSSVDRLNRPGRHRQRRRRALFRRRAQVSRGDAARDCRPDPRSWHGRSSVRIPGVTALVFMSVVSSSWRPSGMTSLPDPVVRIGQPRDGRRGRDLGAHPVVAGLDRGNRGVAVRGVEEHLDGGDHALVDAASRRSPWWSHRPGPESRCRACRCRRSRHRTGRRVPQLGHRRRRRPPRPRPAARRRAPPTRRRRRLRPRSAALPGGATQPDAAAGPTACGLGALARCAVNHRRRPPPGKHGPGA